jgi:protein O-GlcNAc transferase
MGELDHLEATLADCDRRIAIDPYCADAHFNRGAVLNEMGRHVEALVSLDRAIAIRPNHSDAHNHRGMALFGLARLDAALLSYDAAIALRPDHAGAHLNRGNALVQQQQLGDAMSSYDRALAAWPAYAEAHASRGHLLFALRRYEEAVTNYDAAVALKPQLKYLLGSRLHAKMQICDWRDLDATCAELAARIERDEPVCAPFSVVALLGTPSLERKAATIRARETCQSAGVIPRFARSSKPSRIRIGYFSADFHAHATAYLIAGMLECHDRSSFEISLFSFGPDSQDAMRERLKAACDRFLEVRDLSDMEVAALSRELQVDIAVDLNGFTRNNRVGIFAHRAAPLQVSYLGYPGTMGGEFIDYLIADPTLIPENLQRHYSEKIIYMPVSYQVNDMRREISHRTFTRAELGLPSEGFVYCCFNKHYKVTPLIFNVWLRILDRVEGSVFWLYEDSPGGARNLRRHADRAGVNPERLIFAPHMPLPEHLARHRAADLFLDTRPYNAHTTASDALWAGVPVLTCPGETFAGRVAMSLLHALCLPELVCSTLAVYEDSAINLGTDSGRYAQVRRKVAEMRLGTPLFDTRSFTRHIETAYARIWARDRAGLPVENLYLGSK